MIMKFGLLFTSWGLILINVGCIKQNDLDTLANMGLYNAWKLESRAVNGISSLSVPCCEMILFEADSISTDLKGLFSAESNGTLTTGIFEIQPTYDSISFTFGNNQVNYAFTLNQTDLDFQYQEGDDLIEETWKRQ
jgi:hypothetical protein